MINSYATCLLTGENFSPRKLAHLTGLQFYSPSEKGEIDPYTKQALLYGSASLPISGQQINLDSMLDILINNHKEMQSCDVQDIDLTLYLAYTSQCNWYLTKEQLRKIVDLDIGLSITCYEDDTLLNTSYVDSKGNKFKVYLDEHGNEIHQPIKK